MENDKQINDLLIAKAKLEDAKRWADDDQIRSRIDEIVEILEDKIKREERHPPVS